MTRAWLEWESSQGARERVELREGLTMVGGPKSHVSLPTDGADMLQLWKDPPKLLFIGAGAAPRVNGRKTEEGELADGDRIEWQGHQIHFRWHDGSAELVEEIAEALPVQREGSRDDDRAWRRLKAGLLVDLGLAARDVTQRWQSRVREGEYDPDECMREILGAGGAPEVGTGGVSDGDPRLLERCARFERDLLMAPTLRGGRGAARRARSAARGGLAFALAQFIVLAIYSTIILICLLVVRIRWEGSIDEWLDKVRNLF